MSGKLVPNDPRVTYEYVQIHGKKYTYILSEPKGTPRETIFLVHGWPDLSFGWRNQIPYLTSLGFRVVVPNMLGYAGTDCPEDLKQFSMKSMSADIQELARKFVGKDGQIILGGHDWGGALVWRVALWHPELIKAVFSVCTPYNPPSSQWVELKDMVDSGVLANFAYQLQLSGPDVEEKLQGKEKVEQLLRCMYGARGPNGEVGFKVSSGVQFEVLDKLGKAPLLSESELEYYVSQYMLQQAPQLRGPLNWYRTRQVNHEEELPLAEKRVTIEMPALLITATEDAALPPWMSAGMEKHFKRLDRGEVKSGHWALSQAADAVNEKIGEWIEDVLGGNKASL